MRGTPATRNFYATPSPVHKPGSSTCTERSRRFGIRLLAAANSSQKRQSIYRAAPLAAGCHVTTSGQLACGEKPATTLGPLGVPLRIGSDRARAVSAGGKSVPLCNAAGRLGERAALFNAGTTSSFRRRLRRSPSRVDDASDLVPAARSQLLASKTRRARCTSAPAIEGGAAGNVPRLGFV